MRTKPKKPRPDFPLFPHAAGYWAKKVRGRLIYFGKIASDPKGEAAIRLWLDQRDDLLAGRTPRVGKDGLTVGGLCNHFLSAKEHQLTAGDIRPRTFDSYLVNCRMVVDAFGKNRLVDDLAADDFQRLRARLAMRYGVHALADTVQKTRTLFKFGVDAGLIDKAVKFGPTFKKPAARLIRAHRQQNGVRMFEAVELRAIIDAASQPLKAMVLLGINCGFGNNDCGRLPTTAVDLKTGWVNYPRPKTAVERRCPLWPETIKAIKEAIEQRPTPKPDCQHLLFVTRRGECWAKETHDNATCKAFKRLLDKLGLYRPGVGFYALRHTFETIGGGSLDQVAVDHIMGHADSSMAAVYRERIDDDRLRAVTDHIHGWLFGSGGDK